MAKTITGMNASTGPLLAPNQPFWKTSVMTPSAAEMESRLSTAAFSGTSSERKTASSSSVERPTTTATKSGIRAETESAKSSAAAVGPPTR